MTSKREFSRRRFLHGFACGSAGLGLGLLPGARTLAARGACPPLDGASIRWVVPHSLGGGYDTATRLIVPFYEKELNVGISVQNVSGAGGAVGARTIQAARPDGRTIGILNGSGLLAAALSGEAHAPNPATEFTVLARIGRSRHVWATGPDSGLKTVDDVFRMAEKGALIFAIRDVGSTSFVSISLASEILNIPAEVVPGYRGSGSAALAVLRGEVDLVSVNFQSVLSQIEAKELRVLMQVSDEPIADHPALRNVPVLGGEGGVAVRRARAQTRDIVAAQKDAAALAIIIGAGRLIVAPPDMGEALAVCMQAALLSVLHDPQVSAAAARSKQTFDIASGEQALADLRRAMDRIDVFVPIISRAIRRARN